MTYFYEGDIRHAASVELGPVLHTSKSKLSTPPKKRMSDPNSYTKSRTGRMILAIVLLFSLFLMVDMIGSIVDVAHVEITTDGNATTLKDLHCEWNMTGYTSYTVMWYNGSTLFNSTMTESSPWILPSQYTKKGQVWNCTVIGQNLTDMTTDVMSDIQVIEDAPPISPYIINTSNDETLSDVEILIENEVYLFRLISSDPDGQSLIYLDQHLSGNDYCNISSSTGYISCLPDLQPDLSQNDEFLFTAFASPLGSSKSISFNVTPVNDIPYFTSSLDPETITEGDTLAYVVTVSDEENSTGPFTFNVSSDYGDDRIWNMSSDGYNILIYFENNREADFSDRGNHTIFITVCDPEDGDVCTDSYFNLTVIPLNQMPNITNVTYSSGIQWQNLTITVNATDFDTEDLIEFSVETRDCSIQNPWVIHTLLNTSANASGIISQNMTNDHVICSNITLVAEDSVGQQARYNLTLDITNINDPPVIYNVSTTSGNTHDNLYIWNLTAFTDLMFNYTINATDPDLPIDGSESIGFSYQDFVCQGGTCPNLYLDAATGTVSFLPNTSYSGNFSFIINVSDNNFASTTTLMNITVYNNTPPFFDPALEDKVAYEGVLFTYNITADDEQGDVIIYSEDSSLFDFLSGGYINYTPVCEDIGDYEINVTIRDTKYAYSRTSFNLTVLNTNDTPVVTLSNITLLEGLLYEMDLDDDGNVTDEDIECSLTSDQLNFSVEFLEGGNLFEVDPLTGEISFTPNSSAQGNYLARVSASDLSGLTGYADWNITVVNRSEPPVINNITPYGTPTVFGWRTVNAINFPNNMTAINSTENSTISFDHNSTDPENNPLVFSWLVDGVVKGSSRYLNHSWNFSDAGTHEVTLRVTDLVEGIPAHTVSFMWNVSVSESNRPPQLVNNITDLAINGSVRISNFLTLGNNNIPRFYDPDGDTLTYNHTPTTLFTATVSGNDVLFTPEGEGLEDIVFTASDGQYSVISNNITVNVTDVPDESDTGSTPTTTTVSSKTTNTVPYSVIQEVEKEKEIYMDIIVPEPITMYMNNTIRELIKIENNGNYTLRGIHLSAQTNFTNANISFSNDYIPELKPGETEQTDLIITSYKLMTHYELIIWANVTEPSYKDKAIVYINSIEKSKGNQSVTATKITFAEDLLNSNPECLELNEFLKKARLYIAEGEYDQAAAILDSVIQGCKYLVSQSKLQDESPTGIFIGIDLDSVPFLRPILVLFAISMVAAIVLTIRAKNMNKEEDS